MGLKGQKYHCLENVALKCGFCRWVQFSVNTCYLFRAKVFSQRPQITFPHTHVLFLCVLAAVTLVKAEVVPVVLALMGPGVVLSAGLL